MARIYARRKGRSSSSALPRSEHPAWAPEPKEVEELVGKLSKEGFSTAEIGLHLRDSHGIPSVKLATGKAVAAMVRDAGLAPDLPEDLSNLMRKAVRLGEHLESNRKDVHNRRALQLTESKILRLVRYYKRNSVLPDDWKYTLANAKLLVG